MAGFLFGAAMRFCLIEEWKPILGYRLPYAVSSYGRVWSFFLGGRYLKPGIASNGYPTVSLGRGCTRTLPSLVAVAFLGPYPDKQEVRHKDGDRKNPRLDNLEWGTRTDNIYDAVRHGRWVRGPALKKAWETRRRLYGDKGVKQ